MVFVEKPWTGSEVTYPTENNLSPIIMLVRQSSMLLVESLKALSLDRCYLLYIYK